MGLDTVGRGGWGGGSNTMADYCAKCYLQIKATVCLNVCDWMNMTERIAIALIFDLLSHNSSTLVKETSYRKTFININYNNNIPFPFFCFCKGY